MSKNYNEISNQCVVMQTDRKTFATYPNFELPPKERYGEGIQGKVKLLINDFSKGKGDNATVATFNLDIKDIVFLTEKARMSHMPIPYYLTKIIGSKVETEGRFKGLSPVSKLAISRVAKTVSGEEVRYPWKVKITNGYAKAMPGKAQGTFYEGKGTFVTYKEAEVMLTDADFLYEMDRINENKKTFKEIFYNPFYKECHIEYMRTVEEYRNRGSFTGAPASIEPVEQTAVEPEVETKPEVKVEQPRTNAPQPDASSNQASKPDLHEMTMVIDSPFQFLSGNSAVASCLIGGRAYAIQFADVDEALMEAQEKKLAIKCNLYADADKKMHFYSLAS